MIKFQGLAKILNSSTYIFFSLLLAKRIFPSASQVVPFRIPLFFFCKIVNINIYFCKSPSTFWDFFPPRFIAYYLLRKQNVRNINTDFFFFFYTKHGDERMFPLEEILIKSHALHACDSRRSWNVFLVFPASQIWDHQREYAHLLAFFVHPAFFFPVPESLSAMEVFSARVTSGRLLHHPENGASPATRERQPGKKCGHGLPRGICLSVTRNLVAIFYERCLIPKCTWPPSIPFIYES